jgi:hypothetical protein
MTFTFKVEEKDYLVHQLYVASKSDFVRKRRLRNTWIITLLYIGCGLLFYFRHKPFTGIVFVVLGLLWLVLYPMWQRYSYKRQYIKIVRESLKDRFGKSGTLEIDDEYLLLKSDGSESRLTTKEVEAVNEISQVVMIKLRNGQSIILPKDNCSDPEKLIARLKLLAAHLSVPYNLEPDWSWK